jgi:hypothetical protein
MKKISSRKTISGSEMVGMPATVPVFLSNKMGMETIHVI